MYGIELPLGSWAFILDDTGVTYGPGPYPFHRACARSERVPSDPLINYKVATGRIDPAIVRVTPNAANYSWRNEYVALHPLDVETANAWAGVITGLAASPFSSMINLGHSAVTWLNDTCHVARGFTAVLDESGFHIAPAATEPTDMFKLHRHLRTPAGRHGVEPNRLHAYMADYDGPYHNLRADLRVKISPLKVEVRSRRSPVTLTVPAGIVPAGIVPAGIVPAGIVPAGIVPDEQGAAAAAACVKAAEDAGFEVQGWGLYFPGCEVEDSSVTYAGVAIGYRWYALDIVNGTVTARETETVADHETLDLPGQRRFATLRRPGPKLTALLTGDASKRCS